MHGPGNGQLFLAGTIGQGGSFDHDNGNISNNGNTTSGGSPTVTILGAGNQIAIVDATVVMTPVPGPRAAAVPALPPAGFALAALLLAGLCGARLDAHRRGSPGDRKRTSAMGDQKGRPGGGHCTT